MIGGAAGVGGQHGAGAGGGDADARDHQHVGQTAHGRAPFLNDERLKDERRGIIAPTRMA